MPLLELLLWAVVIRFAAGNAFAAGPGAVPSLAPSECPPTETVPDARPTFAGSRCDDRGCGAQKAGFAWADRAGIEDAAGCAKAGAPPRQAGCRAFVDEAVTAEQYGFEWARDNDIGEACLCQGGGPRFEAGCAAFVAGFGG